MRTLVTGSLAMLVITLPFATMRLAVDARAQEASAADGVTVSKSSGENAATPARAVSEDAGASVIAVFRANRDNLKCGVLSWTRKTVEDGFLPESKGRSEMAGSFKMWWDGDRFATVYMQDQRNSAADRPVWLTVESGGSSYDGKSSSIKPRLGPNENWLEDIARWRGAGAIDTILPERHKLPHVTAGWSTVAVDGKTLLQLLAKNRQDNAYSIEHYDLSRGGNLIRREWYNGQGQLYMKHTVKLGEIEKGIWFPVQIDIKSIDKNGKVTLHHHFALDMKRCSFNDRNVLPAGIFTASSSVIEHKYKDELTKAYAEAKKQQGSTAPIADTDANQDGAAIRQLISKFVRAAEKAEEQRVAQLLDKRRYEQRAAGVIKDMKESISLGATPGIISSVIIRDDRALVVTDFFEFANSRYKGKQCLVYEVTRNGTDWAIHDIDMEDADGLVGEIRRFDGRAH